MKRCSKCKQEKELTKFTSNKKGADGKHSHCNKCRYEDFKRRRRKSPEVFVDPSRRAHLRRSYGITPERYDEMRGIQNDLCAICKRPGKPRARQRYALHVDHDHQTGAVRGLLCAECNSILGNAKDSKEVLMAAIEYLQRHSKEVEVTNGISP